MSNEYPVKKLFYDYEARSFIVSSFSFAMTGIFLVYNVWLGFVYKALWNFSIGIYYLLLLVLRGAIILAEKRWRYNEKEEREQKRVRLFQHISRVLLLLDFALIVPIILMVFLQRNVDMGMIPAVSVAAYTTYKVVIALINYTKARVRENISLYGLRIINLKDAVVSVLTLQNTLVMVFSNGKSMQMLTSYTSAGILIGMIALTILLIRKGQNFKKTMG